MLFLGTFGAGLQNTESIAQRGQMVKRRGRLKKGKAPPNACEPPQ